MLELDRLRIDTAQVPAAEATWRKDSTVVIEYRIFRNNDPPALVDIWRNANPTALAQPMNASLLEDLVLGKPYFDRAGLVVAIDDGTPVGFGHAGFGPSEDRTDLCREVGVVCMVAVRPSHRRRGIARDLVGRLEEYLKGHGAKSIYAGGVRPFDPFYSGLYGGNQLPGVLEADVAANALFEGLGYTVADQLRRMRCNFDTFRPVVDRHQLMIRRAFRTDSLLDPPPGDWWEACTFGEFHRIRFELTSRDGGPPDATATLWSLDPIVWQPGVRSVGLLDLTVRETKRRQGLATFLLGEALRQLHDHGFAMADTQVLENDKVTGALLEKLGFSEVDRGNVYQKRV